MSNDEVLIRRVRELAGPELAEKQVFGARCWVLDGNMAFGVHGDDLLVRLGPEMQTGPETADVRPFDPMGRGQAMKGWFLVGQDQLAEDDELSVWMQRAQSFAAALPPK